jgi:D-alanyl-D-alanine carboxypeptidase/D-alanyl-D-alanine-endopeptidase (penicillin-binding protein 4)
VLRAFLVSLGLVTLFASIFAAYVAYEWIRAPGIDDLRPIGADAATMAVPGDRGSGPPPLHIPIAWNEMPASLRNATVAIEDHRFYEHGALDVKGLLRAALNDVISGGTTLQGGSTITQQLARTLYIRNPHRSLVRKIRETKLAMQLEGRHSKQWILWQYLNSIPYGAVNGRVIVGVEAAAQVFFSVPAKRLTLSESAVLAGLPQRPNRYDPFKHPNAARKRRAKVLQRMVQFGFTTRADAARASIAPVTLSNCGAPGVKSTLSPVSFAHGSSSAQMNLPSGPVARQLAPFMREAGPASGAFVYDATARKQLFGWKSAVPRVLASNTKLFTAAAVLDRLPPLATMSTRVLGSGSLRRGTWYGSLYLRGAGDPAFGMERGRLDLTRLVRQLRRRGVKRVRGKVIGDGSLFDSRTGGPDSGGRTSIFVGPLSALSFDHGRSSDAGGAYQANPVLATAGILRAELEKRGIHVSGPAATGKAPAKSRKLASVHSRRVEDLVRRMVKWSDSFGAEILLKDLAARVTHRKGSTANGAREVRRFAARLGVSVSLSDGSGLCRKNKASPREVVRLLNRLRHRRNFPAFLQSLPTAGRDGTLFNRMRSSPARDRCSAKTATLSDVSNLSGYCRTQRGHTIIFSFLMEQVDVQSARHTQDQMVSSLACLGANASAPDATTGLFRPALLAGGPQRKMIALTFDDGPSRFTHKFISTLRRRHARATFFQVGYGLDSFGRQPIGARERREGFTLGTHTQRHPDLGRLSAAEQEREILAGARALTSRGLPFPTLFRPPYDSYNAATLDTLRRFRMRMVLQSVDTQDWLRKRGEIVRRALAGARPGSIILMHDGGGDRSQTLAALPAIIDGLHKRGYRLVNVPTLIRQDPPALEQPVSFNNCQSALVTSGRAHPGITKDALRALGNWRAMLQIQSSGQ